MQFFFTILTILPFLFFTSPLFSLSSLHSSSNFYYSFLLFTPLTPCPLSLPVLSLSLSSPSPCPLSLPFLSLSLSSPSFCPLLLPVLSLSLFSKFHYLSLCSLSSVLTNIPFPPFPLSLPLSSSNIISTVTPEKAQQILDDTLDNEGSIPFSALKVLAAGAARSGKALSKEHMFNIMKKCNFPFFTV